MNDKVQTLRDGFVKGVEQNQKEIGLNMYNDEVDIKTISKYTKLSIDEINKNIETYKKC